MISFLNPIPAIPKPFGPHKVGTVEWEIPTSEIPSSSHVPDPAISTVKFRLFYPTPSSASSKTSVPWLPQPQRNWNEAYAKFLGAGPRLSSIVSVLPLLVNFTTIPAVPDSPLLPRTRSSKYPVVIFSHGLGGNFNAYSAVCTSLASFGIVCAAPEHRDGSAPVSLIRSASGQSDSIPYQRHPHSLTTKVLNSRNAQLRIRLWELEQVYTVVSSLNAGKAFTNYAAPPHQAHLSPTLEGTLDLEPGRVTWVGHSFGATTTVQFVKSVYYHRHLPSSEGTKYDNDQDRHPLYNPASDSEIVKQITPNSPVALLDLWTMPLRSDVTAWLWERPLPCYDRTQSEGVDLRPNVVSVMSAEFSKYTEMVKRTRAVLSARPADAVTAIERLESSQDSASEQRARAPSHATPPEKAISQPEVVAELVKEVDLESRADLDTDILELSPTSSGSASPVPSRTSFLGPGDSPSPSSSQTSIVPSFDLDTKFSTEKTKTPIQSSSNPLLYHIPGSAHLSQSDFGVLFPNFTRYLMKSQNPEETIQLNVRALLSVMRGQGLEVEAYCGGKQTEGEDEILTENCSEARFLRVPLVDME